MLLSTAIGQVHRNVSINHLVDLHLFSVNFTTNRVTDYSTKVNVIAKIDAMVEPQNLNTLVGFKFEIIANATGIARQKVVNFHAQDRIYNDAIALIAAIQDMEQRRDALYDLVLKSMARMQFSMIMAQINSGKDYGGLRNSKVYNEWKCDKPLKPDTEGLVDSTHIVDATYQIVSAFYIEVAIYLLNVIWADKQCMIETAA